MSVALSVAIKQVTRLLLLAGTLSSLLRGAPVALPGDRPELQPALLPGGPPPPLPGVRVGAQPRRQSVAAAATGDEPTQAAQSALAQKQQYPNFVFGSCRVLWVTSE